MIGVLVPVKKIVLAFYQWRPSWSCDHDRLNNLSFPHPKEALYEIWLSLALWFLRRCLKSLNDRQTDDVFFFYYFLLFCFTALKHILGNFEILSRIAQTTAALSKLKLIWRDRTSRLLLRLSWCGRSSYLPSFMPVRAGPWKQKSREGSKPLRCDALYFLQRPCDERGDSQQNPECNWSAWWSSNHGKENETQMVWPHLKIFGHGEDSSVGDNERNKKERKRWEDNIKEWTGIGIGDSLRAAEDREGWKGIVATSSVVPRRPPRLRDWHEMRWDELT